MINNNTHVVFDLDDTLYKEIDYVISAYNYINNYIKHLYNIDLVSNIQECADNNKKFFDLIKSKLNQNQSFLIEKYLELYRFHYPEINLSNDAKEFLNNLSNRGVEFSIITDGRSISQNNKVKALGLTHLVKNIIISEETGFDKPDLNNFKMIEAIYPNKKLLYVADNTYKDFLAPNILNWDTICLLDNGRNIHAQNFDLDSDFLPKRTVKSLKELIQ